MRTDCAFFLDKNELSAHIRIIAALSSL